MPIDVYQIENLFGEPGSYRQPNALPTKFKDQKTLRAIPQIYDMHSGSITLIGDHGNGCKYEGVYYILKRGTPLDIRRKRYLYHMVRDPWANTVLTGRVVVKGDISVGNQDKDLEKHLNKTYPIIEKPAGVARISFDKVKPKGTHKLSYLEGNENNTLKPIEKKMICQVLTHKHLNGIQDRAKLASKYKEIANLLYTARKDIYILGTFYPSYLDDNGKEIVRERCNQALKELLDDENRIAAKVDPSQLGTNKLAGHHCITYKNNSIGTADSTVEVQSIDLSKVTDIKRISGSTLKQVIPDRRLDEDTGIFITRTNDFDWGSSSKIYKLCRRAYLPALIAPVATSNRTLVPFYQGESDDMAAQTVSLKLDDFSEETHSYFYWVDKIDFQLSGGMGDSKFMTWESYFLTAAAGVAAGVGTVMTGGLLLPALGLGAGTLTTLALTTNIFNKYGGNGEARPSTLYGLAYNSKGYKDPDTIPVANKFLGLVSGTWGDKSLGTQPRFIPYFPRNTKETNRNAIGNKFGSSTPAYGMLMFQIERKGTEGERCVYKGRKPKEEIPVYCGIKRTEFLKRFRDSKDKGGSYVSGPLSRLCSNEYISKFFLDYYQLNFLNFVPLRGKQGYLFENTQHKCDYEDEGEISPYLYGGRNCELTQFLHSQQFRTPYGASLENPGTPGKYASFWLPREKDRTNFLMTAPLKLEKPLESGDYLISDLEYVGEEYSADGGQEDVNVGRRHVLVDDGATYTMNLLEDFGNSTHVSKGGYSGYSAFNDIRQKLYICTDLDGNIGIKTAYKIYAQHQLCTDPDQMVTAVDGQTTRSTTYYHFKGVNVNIYGGEDRMATRKLMGAFYKQLGYSVEISDAAVYWDFLQPDEVTSDPEGHLFDLVGSDGYVFIRQDQVHFIIKNPHNTIFRPLIENSHSFKKPEKVSSDDESKSDFQILSELTLTQKINQICTFHHKTYSCPLKTKFSFTYEKDPLEPSIYLEPYTNADKLKIHDYYILNFKNAYDFIDETITLQPETVVIQNMGDKIMFDRARREELYADEDAFLRKQQLGLGQQVVEAEARRAQGDLDMKAYNKKGDIALSSINLVGSIGNAGSSALASGIQKLTTLKRPSYVGTNLPLDTHEELYEAAGYGATEFTEEGGYSDVYSPAYKYFNFKTGGTIAGLKLHKPFKKMRNIARSSGIGGKGGPFGFIGGIAEADNGLSYVRPEMSKRIEEDKRFSSQEIMFKLYENDYTHFRKRQDAAMKIDAMVHTGTKEGPSAVEIEKAGKTYRNVDDTYIVVRYPSAEQTQYLEEYRQEFGVACDIPNQVIALVSGMSENIICFRNIDDEGIVGVNNEFDREGLRNKLLAGVKIVDAEQLKLPYDFFDHNLIVPSVIKDDESLVKKVRELEAELNQCKRDSKYAKQYGIKNFDQALQVIKADAEDPDKLQYHIDSVKREIAIAEQNPENYTEEVLNLYKHLLEALETEHEQVLKTIKTRNDLETTTKRADDAENERDDLREQLNKAHEKTRNLMNEKDQCNASLNRCLAKQNKFSQYITHLQELIDNGVKFAETLGIKTKTTKLDPETPGTSIADLKSVQEQLAEKQKQLDLQRRKIAEELDASKKKVITLEGKVQKCASDSALGLIQAAKHVQGGSYCDFLKAFNDMDGNESTMYTLLTRADRYGFTYAEVLGSANFTRLQAIHQTVKEAEDLLDNNNYFLGTDDSSYREYLLTETGADSIRGLKRRFINNGLYMRSNYASSYEKHLLKTRPSLKISKFYNLTPGTNALHTTYIEPRLGYDNFDNKTMIDSARGGYKKSFGESRTFGFEYSIRSCFRGVVSRHVRYGMNDNGRDGNVMYYSPAFYDYSSQYPQPLYFLYCLAVHISNNPTNPDAFTEGRTSGMFDYGSISNNHPKIETHYEGYSNRTFLIGYIIHVMYFNCSTITHNKYSLASAVHRMSPGGTREQKSWVDGYLSTIYKSTGERHYLYFGKIAYRVLCKNMNGEEAQDDLENELDPPKPPALPEEEPAGGEDEPMETDGEARLREKKIKDVYPGGE